MAGSSWEWKPRGVGDWLDGIFQVYRGAFKPLFGLAASVMLPLGIVDGLAQRDLTRNTFAGVADVLQGQDPRELLTMAESTQGGSTALAFLGVLATTFLSIAGIWLVNEHLHGHRRRIGEAFNATPRLWARSLGVALLVFLGLLLLLAVVMGTSVGVSIVLHATWLNVVGAILCLGRGGGVLRSALALRQPGPGGRGHRCNGSHPAQLPPDPGQFLGPGRAPHCLRSHHLRPSCSP